jgi:transcription antitermination factor NusG
MNFDFDRLHNHWLAVQVRSGREIGTAAGLRERGYEEFVPLCQQKRRWSDRTKVVNVALFTGYVFCRFDAANPYPIISTPGVLTIVGGKHSPVPVNNSEIEALQISDRAQAECRPCTFLDVGQRVEIRSGPLSGLSGIVVRFKNRHRLIISISLLRKSVAIELDSHSVAATPQMPLVGLTA